MEDKRSLLRRVFGYASFREGQEPLIDAILQGRDVFGIMPTGGGKSICYQLPALMLPGLTLVVSPLISLMKDQVTAVTALGVPAAYINSSQTAEEARAVFAGLRHADYKLLYVAPERLEAEGFVAAVREANVTLLAVDEAHCISQWGQDFRPSYLKIPAFLRRLLRRPVVAAFTATATAQVREDVIRLLELRAPVCVTTGFDRPNLRFDVLHVSGAEKDAALSSLLRKFRDRSGIIYCSTRRAVEDVCDALKSAGYPATRYHAGLEDEERRRNQEDFLYDRAPIRAATNAFGMGIDKANVGFVIHYNIPKSMEAYYQEAGRAGRDGAPADCVLLFSPGDMRTARYLIQNSNENPDLSEEEQAALHARDLERLRRMEGYCKTRSCFRAYILDYFGQAHQSRCGNCGNCSDDRVEADVTRQAQMVLSCVQRIHSKLGYYVGVTAVVHCLVGSRSQKVEALDLSSVRTYGLMKGTAKTDVRALIDELIAQGYLAIEPEHMTLRPTQKARAVLFEGERVTMSLRRGEGKALTGGGEKKVRVPQPAPVYEPDDEGNDLLTRLKLLRLQIAREEGVPLYVIFSNATLLEMTRQRPRTMEALLDIPGVGAVKAQRYGRLFLEAIRGD